MKYMLKITYELTEIKAELEAVIEENKILKQEIIK